MDEKILQALRQCPLFDGMESQGMVSTLEGIRYRTVELGRQEVYCLAGMPCKYADIVISGILICRMASVSGKQVEVSRLRSGNLVAPAFIFSHDHAMPVSVETDTRVLLLRMTREEFEKLIDSNSQLRINFIQVLSNINVFLTRKLKFLSLLTIREKVAHFLLELAREQGGTLIRLERSRQDIADSFGIQKFSLLRILSQFEKEGAIAIDRRNIRILDSRLLH